MLCHEVYCIKINQDVQDNSCLTNITTHHYNWFEIFAGIILLINIMSVALLAKKNNNSFWTLFFLSSKIIIIIFLSDSTYAHTTKSQSVSQGPPCSVLMCTRLSGVLSDCLLL